MTGELITGGRAGFIEAIRPLPVTFHRAFDLSRDLEESLETLLEVGADRVLTSVGKASVLDGLDRLSALMERAGDSIVGHACRRYPSSQHR